MAHYCFKQPNNKYTVWSSIVDAPVMYNASKKEVWRKENIKDEQEWEWWSKTKLEDVITEETIECCINNGNMTKNKLLDYFKAIKYEGDLVEYTKNCKTEE